MSNKESKMSTTEKRGAAPTIVANEHGAEFVLLGYTTEDSADGPVECAELLDDAGHRTWLPVSAFRRYFRVVRLGAEVTQ
jgi:hypothetical protein